MLVNFVVFLLNKIDHIHFRESSLDDVKRQGDGREMTNGETKGGQSSGYNPLTF
jgi:hypothetical protein